jgi:hypothetical protein
MLSRVKERVKNTVLKHLMGEHNQALHGRRGIGSPLIGENAIKMNLMRMDKNTLIETYRSYQEQKKYYSTITAQREKYTTYDSDYPRIGNQYERDMSGLGKAVKTINAIKQVAKKRGIDLRGPTQKDMDRIQIEKDKIGFAKRDLNKVLSSITNLRKEMNTPGAIFTKQNYEQRIDYFKDLYNKKSGELKALRRRTAELAKELNYSGKIE